MSETGQDRAAANEGEIVEVITVGVTVENLRCPSCPKDDPKPVLRLVKS